MILVSLVGTEEQVADRTSAYVYVDAAEVDLLYTDGFPLKLKSLIQNLRPRTTKTNWMSSLQQVGVNTGET